MLKKLLAVSTVALIFAACSGKSSLGEGDGNVKGIGGKAGSDGGGIGGGTSGSGGGSVGGSPGWDPCSGKPCGAECSICPPDDPSCSETAVLKFCDAAGQCGQPYPECKPQQCTDDKECAVTAGPCQQCPDGSYACPYAKCENGECIAGFDSCGGQTCSDDKDCPAIEAPCQQCPDGSFACPFTGCVDGKCVGGIPGCGGTDPCAGQPCGAPCAQCPPDDPGCVETAVLKYCDASGQCGAAYPNCGPQCSPDVPCPPVDLVCKPCPDGSCAKQGCVNGQCIFECNPGPEPQCKTSADCPAIELCKACSDGTCAQIACVVGQCQFVCGL